MGTLGRNRALSYTMLPLPVLRRPLTWVLSWSLLLAVVLALPLPSLAERLAPGLRERVASNQQVRVLVELEEGFVPEGRLTRKARGLQRARIAQRGDQVARQLGRKARRLRHFDTIPWLAVEVGAEGLDELERSGAVRSVQVDSLLRPVLSLSIPQIQADIVQTGYDGSGSAVVVIDSGVDASHPFLAGKVIAAAEACFSAGSDCPNGQTTQFGAGAAAHCTWAPNNCAHGTHVAGIAVGDDGAGRVGTAPGADLIPIGVATYSTNPAICALVGENPCVVTQTSDMILALEHAHSLRTSYDIAAVNVSLGGGQWSNQALCDAQNGATKAAIDNLRSAGIPTVIAAGNDGYDDAIGAPACISSAVSVGASTDFGSVPSWTNWAPFLDLLAPGTTVESSVPFALLNKEYKFYNGTSMAAPHVAGSFALLNQALPAATTEQLIASMIATGELLTHGPTGQMKPRLAVLEVVDDFVAACDNGIDDDLDTLFDAAGDPGCLGSSDTDEHSNLACDNGLDDDGDGLFDYPEDPGCSSASDQNETSACGLGFEAGAVLGLLSAVRRRRLRLRRLGRGSVS